MSRTWVLYMHKNKTNGKVYIGITCQSDNPNKRWQNGKHYESNKHFTSAIEKYGWDGFEHIILKEGIQTEAEATALEKEVIEQYNATDREYGYNILEGGKGYRSGYKMTPEHKKHMMESIEKFKTDPAYADWLKEHAEIARNHAKEMWANNYEELMSKMEKTRQEHYCELLAKPVGKIRISKGGGRIKGAPYISDIYVNADEASNEKLTKEEVIRKAKRIHRLIAKGQINFTSEKQPWCFIEDCFLLDCFAELNPIVKVEISKGKIIKIYRNLGEAERSTRLSKKEFLDYLTEKKIYRKKYFWCYFREF